MNKVALLSTFAKLYSLAAHGLVRSIDEAARILGLSRSNLTPEDIKKAFREKAKKAHPDVNPNGDLEMKLLNAARDLLLQYPNISEQSWGKPEASPNPPPASAPQPSNEDDGEELNEMMFDSPMYRDLLSKMKVAYDKQNHDDFDETLNDHSLNPQEVFETLWGTMNDPDVRNEIATDHTSPIAKYVDFLIHHSEAKAISPRKKSFLKTMAWGDSVMEIALNYKETRWDVGSQ